MITVTPLCDVILEYDEGLGGDLETHALSIEVQISPDKWAPGIWAGTEGATIKAFGAEWIIRTVDLDKREVRLSRKVDE